MVVSEELYSPQNYLEMITGNTYFISGDNDVEFIEHILEQNKLCLWSYPLSEIDYIVSNNLRVVLVECMIYSNNEYVKVLRWFEVPDEE